MDYLLLVNRDNLLDKTFIPDELVNSKSKYKDHILVNKMALNGFIKMKKDAKKLGYEIDIMSGYRDYCYQEKIYNRLVNEKGFNYAFRHIAPPGASEHQTGLAIDVCVYRDGKCYLEYELENFEEIKWLHKNAYKYGFILRYPENMEDITGYNYEPWHFRYVGIVASELYMKQLILEEYVERACK